MPKIIPLVVLALLAGFLNAEELDYDNPKFKLTIPRGFEAMDDRGEANFAAYMKIERNLEVTAMAFELYGEELDPDDLDEEISLEGGGFIRDHYFVDWKGNPLDVAVVNSIDLDPLGGSTMTTVHTCFVPLKGQAIVVKISSSANDSKVREYMRETVQSIEGEPAARTGDLFTYLTIGFFVLFGGLAIYRKVKAIQDKNKNDNGPISGFEGS